MSRAEHLKAILDAFDLIDGAAEPRRDPDGRTLSEALADHILRRPWAALVEIEEMTREYAKHQHEDGADYAGSERKGEW